MQKKRCKPSELVLSVIPKIFAQSEVPAAHALLEEFEWRSSDSDRIDLDILEACGGNLERMRELVTLANQDWRDLIVATEYCVKDAKMIMNERGHRRLAEVAARRASARNRTNK